MWSDMFGLVRHGHHYYLIYCKLFSSWYTVQPRGKMQNPRYHQGQNQQFVDRRSDSMRTMIVDKFYHFHHHRGITLNADPSWCRPQWTTTFLYNVLYKPTCTARTARFSKKSLGSDVGEIKIKVGVDTAKCPRKMEHGDLL
jgi:hypothetical protein